MKELKNKWFLLEVYIFWNKYKIMPTLDYIKDQKGCRFKSKDTARRYVENNQGNMFGKVGNRYYPKQDFFNYIEILKQELLSKKLEVPFNPVTFVNIFEERI